MSHADVFRTYLERLTAGDADGAFDMLAEEFTFDGPVVKARNKAEFLAQQAEDKAKFEATSAKLGPIVMRHDIQRQWVDGDEVCSFYDLRIETPAGAVSIPMANWTVVRGGKLVSSRLVFDTASMPHIAASKLEAAGR